MEASATSGCLFCFQRRRCTAILILGVQARLISAVGASRPVFGLTSPPQPLPIPSVAPPDTHRRLKLNLRCVSGGATEGLRRGPGAVPMGSSAQAQAPLAQELPNPSRNGQRLVRDRAWRVSARERAVKDRNSSHFCKHLWLRALLLRSAPFTLKGELQTPVGAKNENC
jgi:hypothetical protein